MYISQHCDNVVIEKIMYKTNTNHTETNLDQTTTNTNVTAESEPTLGFCTNMALPTDLCALLCWVSRNLLEQRLWYFLKEGNFSHLVDTS